MSLFVRYGRYEKIAHVQYFLNLSMRESVPEAKGGDFEIMYVCMP